MICGGQMKIFIDLPTSKTEQDLFDSLQRLSVQKVALYVATVVESEDTEVRVGQKRLVATNGETVGNLGRTTLETEVHQVASEVLQTNEPLLFKWNSGNGTGQISVFIEPIQSRSTLLIAGAGHIGQALCHLGNWTDFDWTSVPKRSPKLQFLLPVSSSKFVIRPNPLTVLKANQNECRRFRLLASDTHRGEELYNQRGCRDRSTDHWLYR